MKSGGDASAKIKASMPLDGKEVTTQNELVFTGLLQAGSRISLLQYRMHVQL